MYNPYAMNIPGHKKKQTTSVERLDIIFRSCVRVEAVYGQGRPGGATKRETTLTCLRSLLDSISGRCTVHVLDDHSDSRDVDQMKSMLQENSDRHKFVSLEESGNGESLEACLQYAKENNFKMIYFCEDDYLHLPIAVPRIVEFYEDCPYDCVIHPTDYTDRYTRDKPYPSFIFLGKDRHWRTIKHTTGTFMVTQRILYQHWKTFLAFAKYNKQSRGGGEDETINRIFAKEMGVSPIPSLAAHYSLFPDMPPFQDWEGLFEKIKTKVST